MRALSVILLSFFIVACSHFESESNIGGRVVSAECLSAAVPWILGSAATMPIAADSATAPVLRAVTYNIHSGLGPQRAFRRSRRAVESYLRGIADAITQNSQGLVDVVGLNEVDFRADRSGDIDEARYLADALERRTGLHYYVVYGETWSRRWPGFRTHFGNAVLVRHPVTAEMSCLYDDDDSCSISPATEAPVLRAKGWINQWLREARGVIKLTIEFHGNPVDILVTHLDAFVLPEREAQAAHLLRRFIDPLHTTLLLGDMNAVPTLMTYMRAFFAADRTHDILTSGGLADARVLYDSWRGRTDFKRWATFPAEAPAWPLDAALGSSDLVPLEAHVMSALYSDHRGLYVEYQLTHDAKLIAAQRARHNAIRRRQLAQILDCDLIGPSRIAKLAWLKQGTEYFSLSERDAHQSARQEDLPL